VGSNQSKTPVSVNAIGSGKTPAVMPVDWSKTSTEAGGVAHPARNNSNSNNDNDNDNDK
jgi:hypothetical protein